MALVAGVTMSAAKLAETENSTSQNSTAEQPTTEQLKKLGLTNAQLVNVHQGIWRADINGKKAGYVINSSDYTTGVKGFHGNTPVLVFVNKAGKVEHIYTLANQETPKYFHRATTNLVKWKNTSAKKGAKMQVDAVSGATYSSNALTKNVQAALAAYNKYCK